MNLRTMLLSDWPLKLTSLFLSVLLWVVASTEEPSSRVVAVGLIAQPPPGRTVLGAPPSINVVFVGPRRELLKVAASRLTMTRLVPDTVTGRRVTVDLAPSDIALPRGIAVHIQDIEPRQVVVELDSVVSRRVVVHPNVQLETEAGFALLGGIQIEPGMVNVSGPEELLTHLDSLSTLPLRITRAEGPAERLVPLDTTTLGRLRVTPSMVTVRIDVQPVSERVFDALPVRLGPALANGVVADPDHVTVTVRGAIERIDGLSRDSVRVLVEPAHLHRSGRARLRVVVPAGFSGSATPDSVTLAPKSNG